MDLLPRAFYEQLKPNRALRRRGHGHRAGRRTRSPSTTSGPVGRFTRHAATTRSAPSRSRVLRDIEVLGTPLLAREAEGDPRAQLQRVDQDPLPDPAPLLGGGGRHRRRHDGHRPADPAHLLPVVLRSRTTSAACCSPRTRGARTRCAGARWTPRTMIEQALEDVAQIHPSITTEFEVGAVARLVRRPVRARRLRAVRAGAADAAAGRRSSRPRAASTSPASTRRCTTPGSRAPSNPASAPRARSMRPGRPRSRPAHDRRGDEPQTAAAATSHLRAAGSGERASDSASGRGRGGGGAGPPIGRAQAGARSSAPAWPAWSPPTSCKRQGHEPLVLEAQNRVGGRVYTLREPFAPGLYAEAGAMRIPRAHDLTLEYCGQFDLPHAAVRDGQPQGPRLRRRRSA